MAIDGMWTLTDEGEWVLEEPYKSLLMDVKVEATKAWTVSVIETLCKHTEYEPEFLKDELLRRCREDMEPTAIVDEFVLEALSNDL